MGQLRQHPTCTRDLTWACNFPLNNLTINFILIITQSFIYAIICSSLQLTSRPCVDGPLPPCSYAGQTGVDPENPSIYYVCVKDDNTNILVYTLRKCEYGWIYNPSTYHCVESETTVTTTSSSTSGTTTTIGDHCQYLRVYPDEENCHYYYLCTEDLQLKHCACFIGFYFNKQQSQCVLGVCWVPNRHIQQQEIIMNKITYNITYLKLFNFVNMNLVTG